MIFYVIGSILCFPIKVLFVSFHLKWDVLGTVLKIIRNEAIRRPLYWEHYLYKLFSKISSSHQNRSHSTNDRFGFWNKCCIFFSLKSMPFWGRTNYLKALSQLLPNGLTVSNGRKMKHRAVNLGDSPGLLCSQDCSYGVRQQLENLELKVTQKRANWKV